MWAEREGDRDENISKSSSSWHRVCLSCKQISIKKKYLQINVICRTFFFSSCFVWKFNLNFFEYLFSSRVIGTWENWNGCGLDLEYSTIFLIFEPFRGAFHQKTTKKKSKKIQKLLSVSFHIHILTLFQVITKFTALRTP